MKSLGFVCQSALLSAKNVGSAKQDGVVSLYPGEASYLVKDMQCDARDPNFGKTLHSLGHRPWR